MVKTLKSLLLWNQKADDLETLYAALGLANEVTDIFCHGQWLRLEIKKEKIANKLTFIKWQRTLKDTFNFTEWL